MAADTELIKVDYIEKETWDTLLNGGGGSSLPAVTSDDNGDLLGVVEGAWGKVDPPAATPYDVPFAISASEQGYTASTEAVRADATAAYAAGRIVRAVCSFGGATIYAPLTINESDGDFLFAVTAAPSNNLYPAIFLIKWAVDGTCGLTVVPQLFGVNASDNGSLLGVSNGAWAKVASTAPMVVTGTVDGTSVTITTTLADIKAAYDAGRTVYLSCNGVRLSMAWYEEESGEITMCFTLLTYDTDEEAFTDLAVVFSNSTTGTIYGK